MVKHISKEVIFLLMLSLVVFFLIFWIKNLGKKVGRLEIGMGRLQERSEQPDHKDTLHRPIVGAMEKISKAANLIQTVKDCVALLSLLPYALKTWGF